MAERTFAAACLRCGAQLRIVDNLPPAADVAGSFRGGMGESFVVVPASDPNEFIEERGSEVRHERQLHVASLEEVSRVEQIMALASGQAEQDHPVCGDCLGHVLLEVQRQVDQAAEEHRIYLEAHSKLEEELRSRGAEDPAALEAEIAEMEAEERCLLQELEACGRQEAELEEELERQRRQEDQLRREEEEFWLGVAEYQLDLEEREEESAATAGAIQYATSELNRLKRTNVLNDMFHISQEGQFGTINNFRIGRLPDQLVPWEEINAAWGQACLLLDALVKKCGLRMEQYRLLPRGSYSAIQAGGDVLELYSTEGGLTRFFLDRRFDLAMSAFLACLKEVTRYLQRDPSMRLPFKIEGDKVGGFSVRVQFNQDERWTKALKFTLTDLKWIIAFVESRDFTDRAPGTPPVA
mmetsp:Transcript_120593/g.257535  ORF Transcript_120593/g.257535 Transcript_120593/m.257535 type:complete len:411 (+) Transcript_120593:53-1285(+)